MFYLPSLLGESEEPRLEVTAWEEVGKDFPWDEQDPSLILHWTFYLLRINCKHTVTHKSSTYQREREREMDEKARRKSIHLSKQCIADIL